MNCYSTYTLTNKVPTVKSLIYYIFILDLTPGFNGLGKDKCNTRRESFKFCDLVRLILEILRYFFVKPLNPAWTVTITHMR